MSAAACWESRVTYTAARNHFGLPVVPEGVSQGMHRHVFTTAYIASWLYIDFLSHPAPMLFACDMKINCRQAAMLAWLTSRQRDHLSSNYQYNRQFVFFMPDNVCLFSTASSLQEVEGNHKVSNIFFKLCLFSWSAHWRVRKSVQVITFQI